ncbi:MAG: NUDIX hydrolase [Micromonosporaceae bacterium]
MDDATAPEVRAAGAVLWRPGPHLSGVEVALIHRPRYDDWTFPKGKAKPGEHPLLNAVREVEEETGTRPVLGRRLRPMFYQVAGYPKRVDFWAASPWPSGPAGPGGRSPGLPRPAGSLIVPNGFAGSRAREGFSPNDEVDKLEWLPLSEAEQRLSYERDAALLREFADGPMVTVPYLLVRHASAGHKGEGPGNDLLRPLDESGAADADELACVLACFGPARVLSSATARCVETVLPYAQLTGAPVTADPAFNWGAAPGTASAEPATRARLATLLDDRVPTIVCGHGETLPDLLAQACGQLGAETPGDPELGKGEFWVLHVARKAGAGGSGPSGSGVSPSGTVSPRARTGTALAAIERHGVRDP